MREATLFVNQVENTALLGRINFPSQMDYSALMFSKALTLVNCFFKNNVIIFERQRNKILPIPRRKRVSTMTYTAMYTIVSFKRGGSFLAYHYLPS